MAIPYNTLVDARVPLFQGKEQDPGPVLVIPKLSIVGYWALVGYFVPGHIDCPICYCRVCTIESKRLPL